MAACAAATPHTHLAQLSIRLERGGDRGGAPSGEPVVAQAERREWARGALERGGEGGCARRTNRILAKAVAIRTRIGGNQEATGRQSGGDWEVIRRRMGGDQEACATTGAAHREAIQRS